MQISAFDYDELVRPADSVISAGASELSQFSE